MKLGVSILIVASLAAQEPGDFHEWMDRGLQALRQGKYPVAAEAFTRAVQSDPSSIPAHLYVGMAYLQMYVPGAESPDNNAMAVRAHLEFQKVLEMDSSNPVAMASDAGLYLNQRRWDEAQAAYEKLVAINPGNADAWYSMGYIAWSRWYPAYSQARKEAEMKPADPGPIRNAALRQALKDKWDRVLQDGESALEKALAINPKNGDAMAYMNLLIRERADLRDTEAAWQADIRVADEWVQKALAAKKALGQASSGGGDRIKKAAPAAR